MLGRCLAVLSAYSFYATGLTLCLFPLFCLLPSAPRCLICASSSCRRSSADNTGGGSGGPGLPGNFLTNHTAAVTRCILASQLAPLCVHCGETVPVWLQCGNITMCTVRCPQMLCEVKNSRRHSNLCDRGSCVSVCMSAWVHDKLKDVYVFSAALGDFCRINSPPCVTRICSSTAF